MTFKISPKPNRIDILLHAVIAFGIGYKYGWAEGLFAFAIVATLDQILWAITGGIK